MSAYDIDLDTDYLPEVFDSAYSNYLLNKLVNRACVRYAIDNRDVKLRVKFYCEDNRIEFMNSLMQRYGGMWDVSYLDIDRLDCVYTINKQ